MKITITLTDEQQAWLAGRVSAGAFPSIEAAAQQIIAERVADMIAHADIRQSYISPAKKWDVFISHASEDKPYIRLVSTDLRQLGLSVFLDEHDLVAGLSLRRQIDQAIINSCVGILFISKNFLAKRLPIEELDALFTLENDGKIRIIPVMLNITHDEIAKSFPILASRFCISARDDPKETANIILNHVENIYIQQGSWAQLVRIDTLCLPWIGRPRFLSASLKMLDDYFPQFWLANRSIKELPESNDIKVARVGDIVRAPDLCDGKFVIVTGHQKRLQLYERHENGFLEFVFQLVSIDPEYAKSIIYIRYVLHESFMEPVPES